MAKAKDSKSNAPDVSKFERARIMGARALQLALGAPAFVKSSSMNPLEIAEEEFEAGKIPMTVVRRLPGGESKRIDAD